MQGSVVTGLKDLDRVFELIDGIELIIYEPGKDPVNYDNILESVDELQHIIGRLEDRASHMRRILLDDFQKGMPFDNLTQ